MCFTVGGKGKGAMLSLCLIMTIPLQQSDYFRHHKSNIQEFIHSIHKAHLCVLYGSQAKHQLLPPHRIDCLLITETVCLLYGMNWIFKYNLNYFLCQSIWDLWCTMLQWDRFSSEYFRFTLSLSFHQCPKPILIYTLLLPEGKTKLGNHIKKGTFSQKSGLIGQEGTFHSFNL